MKRSMGQVNPNRSDDLCPWLVSCCVCVCVCVAAASRWSCAGSVPATGTRSASCFWPQLPTSGLRRPHNLSERPRGRGRGRGRLRPPWISRPPPPTAPPVTTTTPLSPSFTPRRFTNACVSLSPCGEQLLRSTAAPLRATISSAPAASSRCLTDGLSSTLSRLILSNVSSSPSHTERLLPRVVAFF